MKKNGQDKKSAKLKLKKIVNKYQYRPPPANHPLLLGAAGVTPPAVPAGLPPQIDLRPLCLAVRNQGNEDSCSGFATAAFRELAHAVATGTKLSGYLSPAYLYARTRMAATPNQLPYDWGSSLSDEFITLQNSGVCPESFMPYIDGDFAQPPSAAADIAAVPFRIGVPIAVPFSIQSSIKAYLANSQAIAIGFRLYQSFLSTGSDGRVPMPGTDEAWIGGHSILICGYNDDQACWIGRTENNTFGDKLNPGYCYMPYGYESCWLEAWTAPTAA